MKRIGIARAKAEYGGTETVSQRLLRDFRARGLHTEIIDVPLSTFTPWVVKKLSQMSLLHQLVDMPLNFVYLRSRRLSKFDVILTLHPNCLYLEHDNLLIYFQHHFRQAYDLEEFLYQRGNLPKKITVKFLARYRRAIDEVAKIRFRRFPFLAISQNVAQRLKRYWEISARRVIYPGGYDPNLRDMARDYVLYFGRFDWVPKRISLVYEVARRLPDISFIVAGSSGYLSAPREAYSPPENVRLRIASGSDFIDYNEKLSLFSKASCVFYPAYDEDYGIVPVEAMSAGKPCVACVDGGGVTETILDGETGILTRPLVDDLAAAVENLHRDGRKMRERCLERARQFSWERCTEELTEELREALGSR